MRTASPETGRPALPARLTVEVERTLIRLRAERYDEALVEQLRSLPGRRFEDGEWLVPARWDALAQVALLVERLGDRAAVSGRTRRRLERARPGTIAWADGQFELTFSPTPRRLERVRALPERRYLPARRCWQVSGTRAGAIDLLSVIADGDFVAPPAVVARLQRMATPQRFADAGVEGESAGEARRSPTAHWRHHTRGPIFRAHPQRREYVPQVGWCVRVRVDPQRRKDSSQR